MLCFIDFSIKHCQHSENTLHAILQKANIQVPSKHKRKHTSVWQRIQSVAAVAPSLFLLNNRVNNNGLGECVPSSSSRTTHLLPHASPQQQVRLQLIILRSSSAHLSTFIGENHYRDFLKVSLFSGSFSKFGEN